MCSFLQYYHVTYAATDQIIYARDTSLYIIMVENENY